MKHLNQFGYIVMFITMLFINLDVSAQLNTPRGSQNASVTQTVGISKIYINYSRPSVNGREIWGKLVPYGMNNLGFGTAKESPWRAGANENTFIKFTDDVKIEGQYLAAGKYGLHMIVNEEDKVTVIFSKTNSAWGSFFYNPSDDALRVDVVSKTIPHTEQLTFDFINVNATSATAVLNWEKKQIPFKVEVDVANIVMASFDKQFKGQAGFNRQNWEQAAGYALNNGGDLDQALIWINNAISGQFFSQQNFNNTNTKAGILNKLGKQEEALEIMDAFLPQATVLNVHQYGRQLIGFGLKDKALEVFKLNAKNNKDTWPVDFGLARGYSAVGDYEKALKHLKIAHGRAPNAPNKSAIEGYITKLEKGEDIN